MLPANTRVLLVVLCLGALALPAPARACGGCFIPTGSSSPVLQDAERVLFLRDAKTKQTVVWVEVRYNGPSDDFGWVLPLPKVPKVGVGSAYLFDRLDLGTAPRFTTTPGSSENCGGRSVATGGGGCGAGSADSAALTASPKSAGRLPGSVENRRGVTVLAHDQVGPYDYVIIQGKTADGLIAWLNARKYGIPDLAKSVIEAHVQKGDVFVAVRLKTGATAQEVKPITLTMDDAEPCVPLRLTAIAAVEDLTVEALIAGPGRAIPKNHLHVRINPLKVNWFDGASNYGQVVSAAIDEAAGRAFVTEFAGAVPTQVPVPQEYGGSTLEPLLDVATLDVTGVAKAKTVAEVIAALRAKNFPIVSETAIILEQHLGLAAKAGTDKLVTYYKNLHEGQAELQALPIDVTATALAFDLDQNFAQPIKDVLPMLQGAKKLTRLVMRISPKEMTKDPVFAFHPTLPNISRDHTAVLSAVCRKGDFTPDAYRLTLKDVGSYVIGRETAPSSGTSALANNAVDARFKSAPAADLIDLEDESGEPVAIHPDDIDLVDGAIAGAHLGTPSLPTGITLKKAPKRWTPPASDAVFATRSSGNVNATSNACALAPVARGPAALGLLLGGAVLGIFALRRRKPE